MSRYKTATAAQAGLLSLAVLALLTTVSFAQAAKVKLHGMIKSRSGPTMTVQPADSQDGVVVLLTDSTQVGQIQGVLKARHKDMSMAALIPGLEIQVEGNYNGLNQVVASSVKFKGNDLERAQSIQAGLHQTEAQTQRNKEELEKQKAELRAEQQKVAANREAISANEAKIASNRATIQAAITRFGQLDDYYILDEVVVLFGNGKVAVESQYKPQLLALAKKAKTIDAYMVQVVGYASAVGSAAVNQKLSEDRASSVTRIMTQEGDVPLTNLLAPGAMGESRQVADNKSAEGQAQNRRVVVRILQNKGIAGLESMR